MTCCESGFRFVRLSERARGGDSKDGERYASHCDTKDRDGTEKSGRRNEWVDEL